MLVSFTIRVCLMLFSRIEFLIFLLSYSLFSVNIYKLIIIEAWIFSQCKIVNVYKYNMIINKNEVTKFACKKNRKKINYRHTKVIEVE
jgi:hypothetical protein